MPNSGFRWRQSRKLSFSRDFPSASIVGEKATSDATQINKLRKGKYEKRSRYLLLSSYLVHYPSPLSSLLVFLLPVGTSMLIIKEGALSVEANANPTP
jgi:hypothetical protein